MTIPQSALVLAAGLGERMRPLTLEKPKPLLELGGRALIDHALDRIEAAGIPNVVVNLYYLGDMIRDHLSGRATPPVVFSVETARLEMGGGVRHALPLLGEEPFFIVNSDTVWIDGMVPALDRLAGAWNETAMDALLLLVPRPPGESGDYEMAADGRLAYRPDGKGAAFSFRALSIAHPRLFDNAPDGAFSHKLLWDRAEAGGRLFGLAHDGGMYHLSTPGDLAAANLAFPRGA